MIGNPLLLGPEGYQISRSVRLRLSATAYFNRTPGTASNRKVWTWSGWVKRGSLGNYLTIFSAGVPVTSRGRWNLLFLNNDKLACDLLGIAASSSTAVYRDCSAWYHIVMSCDTTLASQRVKVYVNNSLSFTSDLFNQNEDTPMNSTNAHRLGQNIDTNEPFDGYLTEVNFIDGQALTPASFGETDAITGVWKPKKYTGTYGTNGFFLNFSDPSAATAAAIGKDYSGNGNNWTPNNISVTSGSTYDSMLDVPTLWADGGNGRGNYATLNPLRYSTNGTLSEANLKYSNGSGDNGAKALSTIGIPSGKWYFEGQWISGPSNSRFTIGFASSTTAVTSSSLPFERDGSNLGLSSSDIANVAIDFDAGKIWYGKNNVWQSSGDPATGANPIQTFTPSSYDFLYPGLRLYSASDGTTVGVINFGQRPFAYTPPTGFKALNTQNLPEPTIKQGNKWFDATTYTGSGATGRAVTNAGGFQPDLVWIKGRTASGASHYLADAIRGVQKWLTSNGTSAEITDTGSFGLTAFNSNGFTVGDNSNGDYNVNGSGGTYGGAYVGWQWKKGATPGFDVVTYTGTGSARTVAHSLGVAPAMMIVKSRSAVNNWRIYHASLGATKFLEFTTGAAITQTNIWNDTAPTSSVFTVGADSGVNGSGASLVAYLFSEVAGFSKIGSYTGNGSADGVFVFTGFQPRFVLIKRTDTTDNWLMFDTSRNASNVMNSRLFPNLSNAEITDANNNLDGLSNGFKLRVLDAPVNASGGTYVYAAFASNPFKYSLAR
mgnify:CR=1 FL=1